MKNTIKFRNWWDHKHYFQLYIETYSPKPTFKVEIVKRPKNESIYIYSLIIFQKCVFLIISLAIKLKFIRNLTVNIFGYYKVYYHQYLLIQPFHLCWNVYRKGSCQVSRKLETSPLITNYKSRSITLPRKNISAV